MQSLTTHEIDRPTISPGSQENPSTNKPAASSSTSSLSNSSAPAATSSTLKDQVSPFAKQKLTTTGKSITGSTNLCPKTSKSAILPLAKSISSAMELSRVCSNNEATTCTTGANENTLSKSNISTSSDILPLSNISSTTSISSLTTQNIESLVTFLPQSFLPEVDAHIDLNMVIFAEFKNAVSSILVFLTNFEGYLTQGSIVKSTHQSLINDLTNNDLCVESPRFFKISKNMSQEPFGDLTNSISKKVNQNKLHTVNLKKIISNLQKSEKIMKNYDSKIEKLPNSNNSDDAYLKKRNRLIEFSIFLSFKLFKLDTLEYFLYLRDCVNPYHYFVNINKVYQTIYEIILFLDYCSKTVVAVKNDPFFLHNSEKGGESIDLYKNFKIKHSAYSDKLKQLCDFEKNFINNNNGKAVFLSLNTDHPITNSLRFNKSRIEVLVILILNYHIRYLSLIEKFVKDNAGSSIFQMNLLPTNTSTNNFESLVNFIRKKFNTNILHIKDCFYSLNAIYVHESDQDDTFNNIKFCMKAIEMTNKAMKIFNNSFNYLAAVTPLFPSFANSSSTASSRNPMFHQPLIRSQGKIGKSRYLYKKRYHFTNQHMQMQHALTNSQSTAATLDSSLNQQQPTSMDASYLSSSWFIIDNLKKKFDDLLLVKFPQTLHFVTKAMHLNSENHNGNLDVSARQFSTLMNGAVYQRFHMFIGEIDSLYADLVYSIDNEDNFSTLSNFLID